MADIPFGASWTEAIGPNDVSSVRVNRADELERCLRAIKGSENLLIYGPYGIGKTFLVRLLIEEAKTSLENTICISVDLMGLNAFTEHEAMSFPRLVLLEVCKTIWVNLLGKRYTELREKSTAQSEARRLLKNQSETALVRIYHLLLTSERHASESEKETVGASAILKGESEGSRTKEWTELELQPFEFLEFIDEIRKDVLVPRGKERILIVCDEANKLSISDQTAILRRFLQLFATRQVQFVFVTGPEPAQQLDLVEREFGTRLELKGFPEKRHVRELIGKYNKSRIQFSDEAIDVVWDLLRGHPSMTLYACRKAYYYSREKGANVVNEDEMAKACKTDW